MATFITDRIKIINHLQSKGYSKNQAEGFVEAVSDFDTSELATKDFVEAQNANLRSSLIMWFVGVEIATTALIISIVVDLI